MATHSSVVAWRIPGKAEPGGLWSMGLHRVRHDWSDLAAVAADITLPTNVHLVKAMVFPVVMYGCESWTVKKAECQRIDAFERWCWRRLLFFFFFFCCFIFYFILFFNFTILYWFCHISKWICHRYTCVPHPEPSSLLPPHTIPLLRVPWTVRRTNQSILKEISPGCSLEGMMLKLKLQYFAHLMWRVDSLEKTLMLGGIGGRRRRGRQRMRWLDGITDSMHVSEWTLGVGDGQGGLACCDSWGRKESDTTEWLNWTELDFQKTTKFNSLLI